MHRRSPLEGTCFASVLLPRRTDHQREAHTHLICIDDLLPKECVFPQCSCWDEPITDQKRTLTLYTKTISSQRSVFFLSVPVEKNQSLTRSAHSPYMHRRSPPEGGCFPQRSCREAPSPCGRPRWMCSMWTRRQRLPRGCRRRCSESPRPRAPLEQNNNAQVSLVYCATRLGFVCCCITL